MMLRFYIFTLIFCFFGILLFAHEGEEGRILELDEQIKKEPKQSALYLERGKLLRLHGDGEAAIRDFEVVTLLDPLQDGVLFRIARVWLEEGSPQKAIPSLNQFLLKKPNHLAALRTRARAFVKNKQYLLAVEDYDHSLSLMKSPQPEYFLERAKALEKTGDKWIPKALKGLDEGAQRIGVLVQFSSYAIKLEEKRKNYPGALTRLDQIAAKFKRKEKWLLWKGEILEKAGRHKEANNAFMEALKALDKLPPRRRHTPAMDKLEKKIRAAMKKEPVKKE